LRRLLRTLGVDELNRARYARMLDRVPGEPATPEKAPTAEALHARADASAMQMLLTSELCRWSPGMVTAMGVSMGLTAYTILARGTRAQKERWALDLLTLEKVGAWAITEPGSGSDAFGSMQSSARRDGEGYVLSGSKTFITNGPHADTIVFVCKLDDGATPPKDRQVLSFVLDRGTPGLTQSKALRKMGMHSSPTGELFLEDVRVGRDRLLGETEQRSYRSGARDTFAAERSGVAAMALGMVEQCLELCTEYAKTRVQFGKPIGEFQLVQLKLAKMQVARTNIRNMVFRQLGLLSVGKSMSFEEACACKLYSAQAAMEVCLEAVQLFGGNGYMAEYRVEQLCRDAKVLQIYGGTDEIQISQIARTLLA
jgi:alkylation response protein AidB-like acyl-CoA dehydrogenase